MAKDTFSIPSNVMYIEPNYTATVDEANRTILLPYQGNTLLTHKPEDYCITVDLVVEVPSRSNGRATTEDSQMIVMHSGSNGKVSLSFFHGTEIGGKNYLTTAPYEYTTFKDINKTSNKDAEGNFTTKSYVNSENFGISSIDISFDSFQTPQVVFNFVDIRGVSLFAAEQLAHNRSNDTIRNIDGNDTAGSFFKCFFMQPFPKFTLYVKGLYGKPVSYVLNCADFKASFDCTTGNFNATATMIGYAYALLGQINIGSLLTAPLDESFGKEYWNKKVDNGDYTVTGVNGEPMKMITLTELVGRFNGVKKSLAEMDKEKEAAIQANTSDTETANSTLSSIGEIEKLFNKAVNDTEDEVYISNNAKLFVNSDKTAFVIGFPYGEAKRTKILRDNIKRIFEEIKEASKTTNIDISGLNASSGTSGPAIGNTKTYTDLAGVITDKSLLDKIKVYDDNKENLTTTNCYEKPRYVFAVIGNLEKKTEKQKEKLAQQEEVIVAEFEERRDKLIEEALRFNPTIENIVRIIFACLDTYVHCVDAAAQLANGTRRTLADLKLVKTDLNVSTSGNVPAFPRVARKKTEKGKTILVDDWIGKLGVDSNIAPEINLVNGMLNAAQEIQETFSKYESGETIDYTSTDGSSASLSVQYPSGTIDIINNGKWVGNCDTKNFGSVASVMTLRAFSTIGLNSTIYGESDAKTIGKLDGQSFALYTKNISNDFINAVTGGSFTSDGVMNAITDKSQNYQQEGVWPWPKWNLDKNALVVSVKDDKLRLNYSFVRRNDKKKTYSYSIPSCGINGDGTKTKSVGSSISDNGNSRINGSLFIDKDFNKYIGKYDLMDNEEVKGLFKYLDYSKFNGKVGHIEVRDYLLCERIENYSGLQIENQIPLPNIPNVGNSTFNNKGHIHDKVWYLKDGDEKKIDFNYVTDVDTTTRSGLYLPVLATENLNSTTLFLRASYIKETNEDVKAYMILSQLVSTDYNCLTDFAKAITKKERTKENIGGYARYSEVLLCGCALTCDNVPITNNASDRYSTSYYIGQMQRQFDGVKSSIKSVLRSEYKKWKDENLQKIFNGLELRHKNNSPFTEEEAKTFVSTFKTEKTFENIKGKYQSMEAYFENEFSEGFRENYLTICSPGQALQLIHRASSNIADLLARTATQVCFWQLTSDKISADDKLSFGSSSYNGHTPLLSTSVLKSYFDGFIEALRGSEMVANNDVNIIQNKVELKNVSDENIQLAYYQYCKILYDKWLSNKGSKTTVADDFIMNNSPECFVNHNVFYIDTYYNKIGQSVKVNLEKLVELLTSTFKVDGYNIMSFFSKLCGDNRMSIQTVQNFLDLTGEGDSGDKLYNMFTPIPYTSELMSDINKYPSFIFLYVYEPSKNANIDSNGDYRNDSFDISGRDGSLPEVISIRDAEQGYRIPAFGVTYGMQDQSYFTNIDISMDNPITTEAALKAQYNIAEQAVGKEDGGENNNNATFLGQDLFTVHSNNSYTCTVTMLGCAYIQPLMYFQLMNIPLFNGAYIIYKVTHSITPGYMRTTFQGSRVSDIQSPKIDKILFAKKNRQSNSMYGSTPEETMGRQASLMNNCEYKKFPIEGYGEGLGPKIDVDVKVKDLGYQIPASASTNAPDGVQTYIKTKLGQSIPYKYKINGEITVLDLLCMTAICESATLQNGKMDKLSVQLAMTVAYNKFLSEGRKWTFLNGVQHATYACNFTSLDDFILNTGCGKGSYNVSELKSAVREVFEKSPSVLVGKEANVNYPAKIRKNGQITSELTQNQAIKLDDVRRLIYYMCPRYYLKDNETKYAQGGEWSAEAQKAWPKRTYWYNSTYGVQQDANRRANCGMIYTGDDFKWEPKEVSADKQQKDKDKSPSEKAVGLFNAICETCNYSETIHLSDFKIEPFATNKDAFYMSCSPASGAAQLFDIVLQAYSNECSRIVWCCENDSSELPYKIFISTATHKTDKYPYTILDVGVGVKNEEGKHPLNKFDENYKGAHELFYTSVRKSFHTVTESNLKEFQKKYKNFAYDSGSKKETVDKINKALDFTIESCAIGGDAILGDVIPENVFKKNYQEYDVKGACQWCQSHANTSSTHYCARYVREAIMNGGKLKMSGWPGLAKDYHLKGFLSKNGFKYLGELTPDYGPEPGDICVYYQDSNKSNPGHICMWTGIQWCSDFKQKNMVVYSSNAKKGWIYRFDGKTT